MSESEPPHGEELLPLVYDELRRLAARYLRSERPGHTLEPAALVHEAFLRLRGGERAPIVDRRHFVALAARAMRHVLIEHARAQRAAKRGGGLQRIAFDDSTAVRDERASEDVLALEAALQKLEREDALLARIVELRFYGGLTREEVAEELGYSVRWVSDRWASARAWLQRELAGG